VESKKAIDLTVNAANNINKNFGSAFSNISSTWKDSMQGK
jgi:hypothetical protein